MATTVNLIGSSALDGERGVSNGKNHFAKKCKKVPVHNIESEEELEAISVVRVQAFGRRACGCENAG